MRPEHLMDIVKGFIENGNHEIGFRYITTGDGILIPEYPACLIIYDGTARDIHGTHYFRTGFVLQIVVLHANLEAGREDRTREDLELTTKVVELLHSQGMRLGTSEIHKAFVQNEEPALVSTDNITAIGTSLTLIAEVREAFK